MVSGAGEEGEEDRAGMAGMAGSWVTAAMTAETGPSSRL